MLNDSSEWDQFIHKPAPEGFRQLTPRSFELFVDLDSPESAEHFHWALAKLRLAGLSVQDWRVIPSKDAGHFHGYVELGQDISEDLRLLYQCLLGSDLKREVLGKCRELKGIAHPTTFFEPEPKGALT